MSRVSHAQLLELDARLSTRQRQLISAVAEFRLISSAQLLRLLELQRPESVGDLRSLPRLLRSDLAFLADERCLHRLQRRIGGVRAGSAGHLYALGPVGLRLSDLWRGDGVSSPRTSYEPQLGFQSHALAVVDVVLDCLAVASKDGTPTGYRLEPRCWRRYTGPHSTPALLKPDAEVELTSGGFTDHWWLEIDQATERRATLQRKLAAYVDYFTTGQEQRQRGVFPLTVWVVPSAERAGVLREVIDQLPAHHRELFRVVERASVPDLVADTTGGTS